MSFGSDIAAEVARQILWTVVGIIVVAITFGILLWMALK